MSRKKGPGRAHREGLTIMGLFQMFPDNASAERWFEEQRWPQGRFCSSCGSIDTYETKSRKPMPYRCRDCGEYFSVKKGTVMEKSKIGMQKWVIAIYMMVTGIKGTSSMKLHRELGIHQQTAWFMMQRIREGFIEGTGLKLPGPVEVDEAYIGGKRKNMKPERRKKFSGRGGKGKSIIVGVKNRDTREIRATVVPDTTKRSLQGFIVDQVDESAQVYTDEHVSYEGVPFAHESVNHSAGEYVRGQAHTNGVESFWADSGPTRSPIPAQADHRFRFKPITDSGPTRSPTSGRSRRVGRSRTSTLHRRRGTQTTRELTTVAGTNGSTIRRATPARSARASPAHRPRQPARTVVLPMITTETFTMLTHPTIDKLHQLKCLGMAAALTEQFQSTACDALSFEERLGLLVDRELTMRDDRR